VSAPEGFDFHPVVANACVPLRVDRAWKNPQGGEEGRLDLIIVPFDGKIDDVAFSGGVSACGDLVIRFAGSGDGLADGSYRVTPRDVVEVAWRIEKTRLRASYNADRTGPVAVVDREGRAAATFDTGTFDADLAAAEAWLAAQERAS
jgi:hypothetical protein